MSVRLRIVGPGGLIAEESGLDEVIALRREDRFDPGSQVAIRPSHAPLLMQTCAGAVCWRRGEAEGAIPVGRGVLEVVDDCVTVVMT